MAKGSSASSVRGFWVAKATAMGKLPHEGDSLQSQSSLVSKVAATLDTSNLAPLGPGRWLM